MSARNDRDPRDDSGTTMIELVVSLVVMSIAMTIFTAGTLAIYRTVNKTDSLAAAQRQVTTAFQRMDRDLRYASAISLPGVSGADHLVEYLMILNGVDTCVQLRLQASTGKLQRRSWPKNVLPMTPTDWVLLVSPVQSAAPFTFIAPDGVSFHYQSLRVRLTTTDGNGATATNRKTDVTFAALNTSMDTDSATVCDAGRGAL